MDKLTDKEVINNLVSMGTPEEQAIKILMVRKAIQEKRMAYKIKPLDNLDVI